MNYCTVGDVFYGELPNGDITNDEDEFFDEWAKEAEMSQEGEIPD